MNESTTLNEFPAGQRFGAGVWSILDVFWNAIHSDTSSHPARSFGCWRCFFVDFHDLFLYSVPVSWSCGTIFWIHLT